MGKAKQTNQQQQEKKKEQPKLEKTGKTMYKKKKKNLFKDGITNTLSEIRKTNASLKQD